MSKCVCVSSILRSAQDCQKENNFLRMSLDAASQSCKTVYFCLHSSNDIHAWSGGWTEWWKNCKLLLILMQI